MQRHRVGQAADMAGDHRDRAELAHRARIAQQHAVQQRPADVRQGDAAEGLPAAGAQRRRAASSSLAPWSCISGISSRATNGKVTKMVASTMPGTAKMILMSCVDQPRPEPALRAEQQHVDQAGDHRRHRERQSISVTSRFLPRNSNLAMAQAAATPKTTFSGTAIAGDQQRQPDRGERVGLGRAPRGNVPSPGEGLAEHDEPAAAARAAAARSRARAPASAARRGRPARGADRGRSASRSCLPPPRAPALQQVDQQQQHEGDASISQRRSRWRRRSRTAPA